MMIKTMMKSHICIDEQTINYYTLVDIFYSILARKKIQWVLPSVQRLLLFIPDGKWFSASHITLTMKGENKAIFSAGSIDVHRRYLDLWCQFKLQEHILMDSAWQQIRQLCINKFSPNRQTIRLAVLSHRRDECALRGRRAATLQRG